MAVSDVQRDRLTYAVRRLADTGITNAVFRAALSTETWGDGLAFRIATDLRQHAERLIRAGVDPALLPVPAVFTAGGGAAAHTPPPDDQAGVVLSAEAVLSQARGEALVFDGTLDGLRGVPVTDLAGVRGKEAERLAAAGISSVYDLLMRVPLRYIDRSTLVSISDLRPGMSGVAAVGTVSARPSVDYGKRIVRMNVTGGGRKITVIFFQSVWRAKQFTQGDRVILVGDVTVWGGQDGRGGVVQMQNPMIESAGDEQRALPPLLPWYPQSGKHEVSTWLLQRAALEAVQRIDGVDDPVPVGMVQAAARPSRFAALRAVHVPQDAADARRGRDRLAYDELLRLQLALGVRRNALRSLPSVQHRPTGALSGALLDSLPYRPTGAQTRAVAQIEADLRAAAPMNRLLQGDVGAGKTLVALLALLSAVESGGQAVLLAPTEILAAQHHAEVARLLEPLGVTVGFLPGGARSKARTALLGEIAGGAVQIVIGTHALMEPDVQFADLALVVIDEQHRFGVQQRAAMTTKGPGGVSPDVLVMTATPIPRTAALTAFGDLDISVLDELPPGRTPIATHWIPHAEQLGSAAPSDRPWSDVLDQVRAGRQAYVVCPLVEESEKAQAAAAMETADALRAGPLRGVRVDVVTGKQHKDERAAIMRRFESGAVDVLVATTVIEVGVNVPNATVMVVVDAARFGMAQLHQLRGRVGRGTHPGHCFLLGEARSDQARHRLEAVVETTDGHVLAERDLVLRGAGNLAGVAQSGHRAGLLVADLISDGELMLQARADARHILDNSPDLSRYPLLRYEVEAALGDDADWLLKA